MSDNRYPITNIRTALHPYYDIILFVVAMLVANYFWKFTMLGDEEGIQVVWLGMDLTSIFDAVSDHITRIVYWLLSLTNDSVHLGPRNHIYYDTGNGSYVAWSCSGLKQAFIWIIIMSVARGPWQKKLWFIPLGLLCTYLFNILRITLISMVIEHHPESFTFVHDYVFKYLFYGMMFCLWLLWTHKIRLEK